MTTQRPFRFGTGAFHAPSATDYAALARKIEDLGYATLLIPDQGTITGVGHDVQPAEKAVG